MKVNKFLSFMTACSCAVMCLGSLPVVAEETLPETRFIVGHVSENLNGMPDVYVYSLDPASDTIIHLQPEQLELYLTEDSAIPEYGEILSITGNYETADGSPACLSFRSETVIIENLGRSVYMEEPGAHGSNVFNIADITDGVYTLRSTMDSTTEYTYNKEAVNRDTIPDLYSLEGFYEADEYVTFYTYEGYPVLPMDRYWPDYEKGIDIFSLGEVNRMERDTDGGITDRRSYNIDAFLIETDGTEITEAFAASLPGFDSLDILEWEQEERDVYGLDQDFGKVIYQVNFSDSESLSSTARMLLQEYDYIENIYFLRAHRFSDNIYVSNGMMLYPADPEADLTGMEIAGLEDASGWTKKVSGSKTYWIASLTEETKAEFDAAGENSSYAHYAASKAAADEILAEHSDVLIRVEPCTGQDPWIGYTKYTTQNAWDFAADVNTDGEINAMDATQVLMYSAQLGAGNAPDLTTAEKVTADVDGDGCYDANDATYILTYAAEAGAGSGEDFGTFITSK